jgi:hypothetical protein
MPCLMSLTGKDSDFQSLSWATWATESQMENEERISAEHYGPDASVAGRPDVGLRRL